LRSESIFRLITLVMTQAKNRHMTLAGSYWFGWKYSLWYLELQLSLVWLVSLCLVACWGVLNFNFDAWKHGI